jgi:hypothetical protein
LKILDESLNANSLVEANWTTDRMTGNSEVTRLDKGCRRYVQNAT